MQTKRMFWTGVFFGLFLCLLGIYSTGCADMDETAVHSVSYGHSYWQEDGDEPVEEPDDIVEEPDDMKTTSDMGCEALQNTLYGRWQGIDDYADRRITMGEDGMYLMEELVRGRWRSLESGKYWVDLTENRGMMRPVLHLEMGGQDDYPVRYRIDDDILVLEEMTETPMRFVRDSPCVLADGQ